MMATITDSTFRITLLPPPGDAVRTTCADSSNAPSLFYDALAIRMDVFVTEQGCRVEEELDDDDAICWHWVLSAHNADRRREEVPAATVRLVPASTHDYGQDLVHGAEPVTDQEMKGAKVPTEPNFRRSNSLWDGKERYAKIGRLATRKGLRGRGFGKVLVQEALKWAGEHPTEVGRGQEWDGLVLAHAQTAVVGWYSKLGWVRDEGMGVWREEGIEHVGMWKRVCL